MVKKVKFNVFEYQNEYSGHNSTKCLEMNEVQNVIDHRAPESEKT